MRANDNELDHFLKNWRIVYRSDMICQLNEQLRQLVTKDKF